MKILLLEDDLILNEILLEHLESKDYEVISTFSGDEAQEYLYSQKFDLLLLDVNVPSINGFELLNDLRENGIKTPAIFLTSLSMVEDIEKGFNSGCDDYIRKPFELKELDIRINNIKRLFNISTNKILKINEQISLDSENLTLFKNKLQTNISKKESEVLKYLFKNKNRAVSTEELSTNVWSYENTPNDSTIRTYIKNIRKVLGDEYISNIRGVGYRFNSN